MVQKHQDNNENETLRVTMKTQPYAHQLRCFDEQHKAPVHFFYSDPGTGKSKMTIDTADYQYQCASINAVVVIAPNGVHTKWHLDEIPEHSHFPYHRFNWESPTPPQAAKLIKALDSVPDDALLWFTINYEAAITKRGYALLEAILKSRNAMMVLDESHRIKNPKAKRTRALLDLALYARARRCLSGTPMPNGPLDIYTQFKFLDVKILGYNSYYGFRSRYATVKPLRGPGGRTIKIVDPNGYKNLEELRAAMQPYTFRAKKDECLDLPDKVYERVYVTLTKEQRRLYNALRDDFIAEYQDREITAENVLTRLLRFQQITGGFMPDNEGREPVAIEGGNPKLNALLDIVEDNTGKAIIFTRFIPEVRLITTALRDAYGHDSTVQHCGTTHKADRKQAIADFQNKEKPRFFVAQVETAKEGIDLFAATTVVYYSNTFSYDTRKQSEDRAHRIGQTESVTYYDIEALDTLDRRVIEALRFKRNLSAAVTGDEVTKWI